MGIDLETLCELEDVLKRDVALRALDGTDIGAVQAGTVGELFLGEPGRGAKAFQIERKCLLWFGNLVTS